jgi:hypothetical protein
MGLGLGEADATVRNLGLDVAESAVLCEGATVMGSLQTVP